LKSLGVGLNKHPWLVTVIKMPTNKAAFHDDQVAYVALFIGVPIDNT
jgi:hypothetical protein